MRWLAAAVSWLCGVFLLLPVYERCVSEGIALGRRMRYVTHCTPTTPPWFPLAALRPEARLVVLLVAFGLPLALALLRPSGWSALARFSAGILMALWGLGVLLAPFLAGVPRSQGMWLAAGALWVWTAVRRGKG